jgi:eukaryotic-like serine/threonine-protein kinase
MDTRAVVARFESERQALALMEHPNIAKIFDAGATPEGRPFFVMEYVSGLPITTYCDNQPLTVKERLALSPGRRRPFSRHLLRRSESSLSG